MAKAIWGLDFGNWALKVARGTYDRKSDTLLVDVLDEIVYGELSCGYDASPTEKHRAGIIEFQTKYQITPGDDVCVAVTGSEVFSRFINLPPVPESIDEIIRYEARQQIPFDIDDVVWDYQTVKEEHEIGEEIEVGLFALKKERVEELMDLLSPWRKNLRVVQNSPLAVYNLLAYEGLVDEPAIVLDVGATTTDVLVLNPPRFWIRTLLVAGDDLTNALMEQFGISNAEAEKIKRRAARSQHREQILRVLQPVFDDLTNEVQRSLGYYKSIARDVRFDKALALGSALKMTGLAQMLAGGLQYQVQPVTQLSRVQLAENLDPESVAGLLPGNCAALGLLVQGAGQARVRINMVPEEVAMAGAVGAKKPWLLAAAAALLVIVGVMVAGERKLMQAAQAAPDEVNWSPLDSAKKTESAYSSAVGAANKAAKRLESLATPGIDRDIHLRVLPAFLDALPREVFVPSLRLEWIEPDDLKGGLAGIGAGAGAGGRGGAMGPTGGRPTGAAGGAAAAQAAAAAGAQRAMAGGMSGRPSGRGPGGGGGGRGRAAGAGAGGGDEKAQPLKSNKSVLVLRFAGESTESSREFLKAQVFEALRQVQLPDAEKDAFREVKMIGEVRDIYRNRNTLALVAEDGESVQQYLAFEGYAVVNVGPEAGSDAAPAAEAGGRRGRRGR